MDDTLSPLEREYRQKLLDLFSLVNPRQPQKGVQALLTRARERVLAEGIPPEQALTEMYAGAEARTMRRVALLNACTLKGTGPGG